MPRRSVAEEEKSEYDREISICVHANSPAKRTKRQVERNALYIASEVQKRVQKKERKKIREEDKEKQCGICF